MSDAFENNVDPAVRQIREARADRRRAIRELNRYVRKYLDNPTEWYERNAAVLLRKFNICGSSRGAGRRFLEDLVGEKEGAWANLLYFFFTIQEIDDEIHKRIYLKLLNASPFFHAELVTSGFACFSNIETNIAPHDSDESLPRVIGKVLWVYDDVQFDITPAGAGGVTIIRVCPKVCPKAVGVKSKPKL